MFRASSRALILITALATLGGCAHASRPAEKRVYPKYVMVTGSRIPQPVDPRTGIPEGTSSLRFYSLNQLYQTGRIDDVPGALQSAVPDLSIPVDSPSPY